MTAVVVSIAVLLIMGGGTMAIRAFRRSRNGDMPAPVRATTMATIIFLAFCGLEFSDGLIRQDGRVFYWTSVLFLPALALLYGLVAAQRWAWWTTRVVAVLAVVWFVAFTLMIPFADVRAEGVRVPWQGRLYMGAVSVMFASLAAYAFRALGRSEAREYFDRA